MVKKIFYKKIAPMVRAQINNTGKGFMIFISTPRHKNGNMAKLFKKFMPYADDTPVEKLAKKRWMLRFLSYKHTFKHDGVTPILNEQSIAEAKMESGEDDFEIEYGLSFLGSQNSMWYGKQLATAETENRIREFGKMKDGEYINHYWKGKQTYVSWDMGVKDFTDLWFFQLNERGKPRFILHHRMKGVTWDYYIDYVKRVQIEMQLGNVLNILPHDGAKRMDINKSVNFNDQDRYNVATRRIDYFIQQGLNCILMDRKTLGETKWRIKNRINSVRKEFADLEIDDIMCSVGIELLRGYIKKFSRSLGEYTDVPDHDANDNASDCADSFSVAMMYYIIFLKLGGEQYRSSNSDYFSGNYNGNIKY